MNADASGNVYISMREAARLGNLRYNEARKRLHSLRATLPSLLDLGNPNGSVNKRALDALISAGDFGNREQGSSRLDAMEAKIADLLNDNAVLKLDVARIKRVIVERINLIP